jgi:hypothetical protein
MGCALCAAGDDQKYPALQSSQRTMFAGIFRMCVTLIINRDVCCRTAGRASLRAQSPNFTKADLF